MTPADLVARLDSAGLLVRTGVVLLPPQLIGSYRGLATRWGASAVDLAGLRLERAPQESKFLGIHHDSLLVDLEHVAASTHDRRTVVVANVDVLLARLDETERAGVWSFLRSSFRRRPSALLLLIPNAAEHLFSVSEARLWDEAGRLCRMVSVGGIDGAGARIQEDSR